MTALFVQKIIAKNAMLYSTKIGSAVELWKQAGNYYVQLLQL